MKKIWPWILGLSILILVVVVVLFGTGLVSTRRSPMTWGAEAGRAWGDGYWHHHSRGMRWGLPKVGLFGWLFVLLIPLSFLGLIVLGVIFLVKAITPSAKNLSDPQMRQCRNCGKRVEPDWSVCPHCGESLGGE